MRATDIGEVELIEQIFLPDVKSDSRGDDCAYVQLGSEELLWSIDPCPTPVAELLGICSAETWGAYTATINLSDIAACGGTPIGMLVSLEFEGKTELEFLRGFQRGLNKVLGSTDTALLGGNVKSSDRFNATGTAIGKVRARQVTRKLKEPNCNVYVIGNCGSFWAGVVGQVSNWEGVSSEDRKELMRAILEPRPQTEAGMILGDLAFEVACMDCSDGLGSAIKQLATENCIDVEILSDIRWSISLAAKNVLSRFDYNDENACFQFGDWQLACLVPVQSATAFETALHAFPITKVGTSQTGNGLVKSSSGARMSKTVMNKNFNQGYNSFTDIHSLIENFMMTPIFKS